jgi:hypothetical protein
MMLVERMQMRTMMMTMMMTMKSTFNLLLFLLQSRVPVIYVHDALRAMVGHVLRAKL